MRQIGLAGLLITVGCASTSSVALDRPTVVPQVSATCAIFVVWPTTAPAAFRGNAGVAALDVESLVAHRILEVVREQCPGGQLVRPTPATPVTVIPGYAAAMGGSRMTTYELQAANSALELGVNYLLVPTIEQWNQNRTDDPIGALITPRNRIAISLRLVRLHNPGVVGRVSFTNRSRITLNQSASRLLDDDFDAAVRALLGDQAARRQ